MPRGGPVLQSPKLSAGPLLTRAPPPGHAPVAVGYQKASKGRTLSVLRPLKLLAISALCTASATPAPAPAARAFGQNQDEKKAAEQKKSEKKDVNRKGPVLTGDNIAETVVLVYGGRPVLEQVRRTGVERGRVARTNGDGSAVEISYERFFKRGETSEKDKIRLDQKRPNLEYSIIYSDGRVWGLLKGTPFTPRQEELAEFDALRQHGIETLLRYKENGATPTFVSKDNQKNIELWVLDLVDKEKRRTRYYISAQTGRVLWLEYEAEQPGGPPVKYRKTFHDYRIVQGTRVPYRTVLYANDRKLEEQQIMTVTYGVKMEDATFKNEAGADNSGGF